MAAQPIYVRGERGLLPPEQTRGSAPGAGPAPAQRGSTEMPRWLFYFCQLFIISSRLVTLPRTLAPGTGLFQGVVAGLRRTALGLVGVLHLLPIPPGSILRRWKRNWFVLYLDGSLVYYHDETQRDMDGRIHVKYSCRDVRTGRECGGERSPASPSQARPAQGSPRSCDPF